MATPYRRPLPARRDPAPPGNVAAAAGGAIVSAARVGRLLGRAGWRIARQLPGGHTIEREAQRLQRTAIGELKRVLEIPQGVLGAVTGEESRAMLLVQNGYRDPAPLRSAMAELLGQAAENAGSQDYLFGTIMSQLVPDEARILAALSTERTFATADVVIKPVARASRARTVLRHASTVGRAAGVGVPDSTATYLARLAGFGLVEFGPEDGALREQYEQLADDPGVRAARQRGEERREGPVRLRRGTVSLTRLGRDFWVAAAPAGGTAQRS